MQNLKSSNVRVKEYQNKSIGKSIRKKKKRYLMDKIDRRVLNLISIVIGICIWQLLSLIPSVGVILVGPVKVFKSFIIELQSGRLMPNIYVSLSRVLIGFSLGLVAAIPIAFLMGWYSLFRAFAEPWIQFFRTIPPIALIPLVIVAQGVGESSKILIIFFSTFLVMVISIYQGVRNVDVTLIKAAKVLGANDKDIFLDVIVPASFPYILVGIRLGLATGLTTLVASELTGASKGLGNMIMEASLYFKMDIVILGIIIIGVIGFTLDKIVLFLERKLTGWQEIRE